MFKRALPVRVAGGEGGNPCPSGLFKDFAQINEEESARLGEGGLGWVGLKAPQAKPIWTGFFFAAASQVFFIAVK